MKISGMSRATSSILLAAALGLAPARLAAQQSGPDVWAANCGSCHRSRSLDTYTAPQWNAIATHMGLVARLTPDETRAVREFLVGSARAQQSAATMRDLIVLPLAAREPGGGAQELRRRAPAVNPGPTSGRDVFRSYCAACHGAEGRGNGPAAAAMSPRPVDLTNPNQRQATTDSAVAEVVQNGRRGMPAFGRMLSRAQMDSVVAYLKTIAE